MSRQGLEIFYLVRFRIFEPYQSSKNKIKQLKSIEKTMKHDEKEKKQVNMMKREKTTMNNYENIGKKQ